MVLGEDEEVQEVQELEEQLAGAIETIKKDSLTKENADILVSKYIEWFMKDTKLRLRREIGEFIKKEKAKNDDYDEELACFGDLAHGVYLFGNKDPFSSPFTIQSWLNYFIGYKVEAIRSANNLPYSPNGGKFYQSFWPDTVMEHLKSYNFNNLYVIGRKFWDGDYIGETYFFIKQEDIIDILASYNMKAEDYSLIGMPILPGCNRWGMDSTKRDQYNFYLRGIRDDRHQMPHHGLLLLRPQVQKTVQAAIKAKKNN